MKKQKKVEVSLSYKLSYFPILDKTINRYASINGGEEGDSGSGLGQRDMYFTFPSREKAQSFVKIMRKDDRIIRVKFE
jgi:hypothetical protein